ncbi:hypothetical protein TYRP_002261 [Tyrophagus putrescentiae]|nr:hypothetical protein TYRP_002261 [Tyrophagus putrescentiae]
MAWGLCSETYERMNVVENEEESMISSSMYFVKSKLCDICVFFLLYLNFDGVICFNQRLDEPRQSGNDHVKVKLPVLWRQLGQVLQRLVDVAVGVRCRDQVLVAVHVCPIVERRQLAVLPEEVDANGELQGLGGVEPQCRYEDGITLAEVAVQPGGL